MLRRLGSLVLFAVVATGLLVFVARAVDPGYFSILRLRVWAGWALLIVGGPVLAHHLAATSRVRWTVGAALVLIVAGVLALYAGSGVAAPEGRGAWEHTRELWDMRRRGDRLARVQWVPPATLGALMGASLLLAVAAALSRLEKTRAARWWGLFLTLLVAWAAVSGAGLPLVPRDHLFAGLDVHSAVGVFAIAALAQHSISVRLARRGTGRLGAAAVTVGGLAVQRVEHLFPQMKREWAPGVEVVRTPRTKAERAALLAGELPVLDASVKRDSMTCMAAGCHPEIGREWASSPHRFAATNAFYRAAVGDLLARGDREGAVFCAGCHDPERVLTGDIATTYTEAGAPEAGTDGVSCLVCHAMVAVGSEPPGNGLFTVAAAPPHTADAARFREDVKLDARRHTELLGLDEFVLSPMASRTCHRLQLGADHGVLVDGGVVLQNAGLPESAPGYGETFCEECHLPRIERGFDQYTHRMPGINVDQGLYVPRSHPEDDALIEAFSRAAAEQAGLTPRVPIDAPEWPPEPVAATYFVGLDETPRILSLRVRPTIEGGRLHLDATTRNLRVGHDFPSGPLDLQQIWMEVRVSDAGGRVLHHAGDLDEAGAVEGEPPRLGGRELDANGEDIRRHRLFEIATVEKRALALGAAAEDRVTVALPRDVAYPLDVRARWLFRRANPTFARWALGGEEDGVGSPLPAHEVVTWQGAVHAPDPAPGEGR